MASLRFLGPLAEEPYLRGGEGVGNPLPDMTRVHPSQSSPTPIFEIFSFSSLRRYITKKSGILFHHHSALHLPRHHPRHESPPPPQRATRMATETECTVLFDEATKRLLEPGQPPLPPCGCDAYYACGKVRRTNLWRNPWGARHIRHRWGCWDTDRPGCNARAVRPCRVPSQNSPRPRSSTMQVLQYAKYTKEDPFPVLGHRAAWNHYD